jgi:hypothetical protein
MPICVIFGWPANRSISANCALDVLGIDPNRAKEPARRIGLEPAVQQPVVHRGADPAVEQVIGDIAARQRVEDREVHTSVGEQVPGHRVGIGTRVAVAVKILPVIPAGGLVPLLFDVRDRTQLVRGRQVSPDLRVVAEMRLNSSPSASAVQITIGE